MALDDRKGVWKSGKGKGRHTPKGRQVDDAAWDEVRNLLGDRPRDRDLLIESRLARRLPNKHVSAYGEAMRQLKITDPGQLRLWEGYYRCRLLQDMVSGMTDQYALDEYRELLALST